MSTPRLVTGQNNQNLLLRIGSVSELGRERVSTCVETEASWWDVVDQPEGPATRCVFHVLFTQLHARGQRFAALTSHYARGTF